jgi:hypothetical protein
MWKLTLRIFHEPFLSQGNLHIALFRAALLIPPRAFLT